MIGLGIILAIVLFAVYAATQPTSWNVMTQYCATNQTNGSAPQCSLGFPTVCTYPVGSPPPGPNCYQTPTNNPSDIAPTWNSHTLSGGPLPLGALTINPDGNYFFSTYQGLLRGADWSLIISVSVVAAGALIGLLVGAISGFMGGTVDESIMRIVDIFLSIPQILFVIIFVVVVVTVHPTLFGLGAVPSRMLILIVGFVIIWWPFYARVVRGQVLVVREQKYVEAAQASGASRGRIILRHIIPNSVYPVFIQLSLDVGTIPLFLGSLVYLGFSTIFPSPYFPEWGSVTALAVTNLQGFLVTCQVAPGCVIPWWQILFPGLALFMYAISVNFLSDGLRDALDPRLRR
ncbi:MAG: ABC transporter permease [Thermoplasmata archaeon]|nr:ABC transporter permease [Thermoplasmata archaeon]